MTDTLFRRMIVDYLLVCNWLIRKKIDALKGVVVFEAFWWPTRPRLLIDCWSVFRFQPNSAPVNSVLTILIQPDDGKNSVVPILFPHPRSVVTLTIDRLIWLFVLYCCPVIYSDDWWPVIGIHSQLTWKGSSGADDGYYCSIYPLTIQYPRHLTRPDTLPVALQAFVGNDDKIIPVDRPLILTEGDWPRIRAVMTFPITGDPFIPHSIDIVGSVIRRFLNYIQWRWWYSFVEGGDLVIRPLNFLRPVFFVIYSRLHSFWHSGIPVMGMTYHSDLTDLPQEMTCSAVA